VASLVALGSTGCASKVGWEVTTERTCSIDDPAIVCVVGTPDFGHTVRVGDANLLPGECVAIPDSGRGGQVVVFTHPPSTGRDMPDFADRRWVRAPRSRVTIVAVDRDGQIDVVERVDCDRQPF
jgi:hypothetical protein